MKKLIFIALFTAISSISFSGASSEVTPRITEISNDAVSLMTPSGQSQALHFSHPITRNDISFEDLNFDGYMDIKVLSSTGNAEKFYDVYLFNTKKHKYEYSKVFSDVPCVEADQKTRQIIGACFHASACENWIERYSVDRLNQLHLRRREGTYCDPSTGDAFSYVDLFNNGRRVSSKTTPLHKGEHNR